MDGMQILRETFSQIQIDPFNKIKESQHGQELSLIA